MFSEENMYDNGGNSSEPPAPASLLIIPFIHGGARLVALPLCRISACSAACASVPSLTQGGLSDDPTPEWTGMAIGSLGGQFPVMSKESKGLKPREYIPSLLCDRHEQCFITKMYLVRPSRCFSPGSHTVNVRTRYMLVV